MLAKKRPKNKEFLFIIIYIIFIIFISIFLYYEYKNNNSKKLTQKINNLFEIQNKETELNKDDSVTNKEKDDSKIVKEDTYKCPTPYKDYEDMSLLNVNQEVGLTDTTYTPKNLKEIEILFATREKMCLMEEANYAFKEMAEKAKKEKIIIKISSAFRDYKYQESLFKNSTLDKNGNSLSTAKPGYSEHQLGTAIDITGSSINYISASSLFHDTKEDLWLKENSHLYGFVQSYPYGKQDITGYKYEPWHYRYIGKEKAIELKNLDITLKEYLEK